MSKVKIKKIQAREILDSRGNPTVEVKVILDNKIEAKASVPSGASTGIHEALELRDGDKKRYGGLGVKKACVSVDTKISKALIGMDVTEQKKIDQKMIELDGTKDKSGLGANAILGVSLACARAGALVSGKPLYKYLTQITKLPITNYQLPIPMFNIFNGGKHADTNLDFQEFMVIPIKNVNFAERVRMGAEIFHELGHVLKENYLDTDVGNEGGYAPNIDSSVQAIELIMTAIERTKYKLGQEIGLGIDVGASELYDKQKKLYTFDLDDHYMMSDQLISLYRDWCHKYPIILIEDGLAEDDWEGWMWLQKEFKNFRPLAKYDQLLLVGDDLLTTNTIRLGHAIADKACNTVLVKPNQIGTLTETFEFVKMAKQAGMRVIVSHRSGETSDDFVADLAVAIGADLVKFGSLSRSERLVKWNRLMEIEEIEK